MNIQAVIFISEKVSSVKCGCGKPGTYPTPKQTNLNKRKMASANNMLKFIWGKGQGPTAERVKIQKQLFGFSR